MYPGPFKPVPMGFQYPAQQTTPPLYQSPYAGYNAFVPPTRERSVPATARPNPPPGGPYPATSTRQHSKHSRQAPYQHYEYCSNHDSKCKRYQRRQCGSPNGAADQSLYSDEVKTSEELNRSPTPPSKIRLKQEEINNNDHEPKSYGFKQTHIENFPGVEEPHNSHEYNKRKSRSKRRAHHRHHHHPPQPPPSSQKRSHHQPLYNSHYQNHEETSRRDDGYYKHTKRQPRGPHDDNHHAPGAHPDRPYSNVYSPYSAYQPPPVQAGYYNPGNHYNPPPPPQQPPPPPPPSRPHAGGHNSPFEREIQRLRDHIHALENELHILQRKVHKTTINHAETSTQDDYASKKHRTKRHGMRSPRQTPVIVEINNTHGDNSRDASPKKPHHRSGSHVNSNHGKNHPRQSSKVSERHSKLHNHKAPSQSPKEQEINPCDCSYIAPNHVSEPEPKPIPIPIAKQPREDTAVQLAQLAHAAAARVQARQLVPPPPPVQHPYTHIPDPLPPQAQQIRDLNGPHPQPLNSTDLNHNQSNNNEIYNNVGERNNRSAEKILDAFERFYKNIGRSSTTPVKVKYIPGETNCNHCQQRSTNINNNNPCPTASRISQSSSSTSSSSERVVIQECKQKTTYSYD